MIASLALILASRSSPPGGSGLAQQAGSAAQTKVTKAISQAEKEQAQLERDIEGDIKLGNSYAKDIDKELKPSEDVQGQKRIDRIGAELATIANSYTADVSWGDPRHTHFPYKFKLVKGKDVNAFSIPGGQIYVYDGLLEFIESDDELAAVLGHEISHASFRHMAVLRREQAKFNWLQLPLLIAVALSRSPDAGNVLAASQYAIQGLTSGWSVKAETAADYGGIQYEVKSHYNPVGALTFMERLAHRDEMSMKVDWGIFQTHPPSDERANFIMDQLQIRGISIRRSQTSTSLAAQVRPGVDGGTELWFGKNKIHTFRGVGSAERSQIAQIRMNGFLDSVPEAFEATVENQSFIQGRNHPLFDVSDEDVRGLSITKAAAAKQTLINLKRCLLDLSYRLYKRPRYLSWRAEASAAAQIFVANSRPWKASVASYPPLS